MSRAALNLLTLLLTTLVSASLISAPRTAEACSPPQRGIFTISMGEPGQTIPLNGAWAFHATVQNTGLNALSVEVRDANDALVNGDLTYLLNQEYSSPITGRRADYLVIWNPTEPLRPEHPYSVKVYAPSSEPLFPFSETLDEQTTFVTTAGEQTTFQTAALIKEPSIQIVEKEGGIECCYDSSFCDSCGNCDNCWATQYVYRPRIDLEIEFPANELALQTYYRVVSSNGAQTVYWDRREPLSTSVEFLEGDSAPYCVTLQTVELATLEIVSETETCFERSDLPDFSERELEGVTRPETCEDAPDAGGGSDAGTADADNSDTTGQPDIGEEPNGPDADAINPLAGNDLDRGCGCSSAPNSPSSLLGMMLFLAALGVSRRALILRQS